MTSSAATECAVCHEREAESDGHHLFYCGEVTVMSLSIIDAAAKNFLHVIYFRKYLLHVFETLLILVITF
jgi:hypothetical protein